MKRQIIKIDEDKCTGCALCIQGCPEGALQIIEGKARLVSDLMCDGLGACIGECPEDAIKIEVRDAEPYDEIAVIKKIVEQGEKTIIAHLKHLHEHGEHHYLKQARDYLKSIENDLDFDLKMILSKVEQINQDEAKKVRHNHTHGGNCPGAAMHDFGNKMSDTGLDRNNLETQPSALKQWPIQMHLINPNAPYFINADVVLAADCVAFSLGDFHQKYLIGKSLVIACPKLDQGSEIYIQKLCQMIDVAKINTLNVMIMEVPCCGGLLQFAKQALEKASRKIPIKKTMVSIRGNVLTEEWV